MGIFTVTAAGPLAALGVRKVGDEPWPQEIGLARAERILTLAEVPWATDGVVDVQVLPRDVDAQPALGVLQDLAGETSAAVFDVPHGEVIYQALSGRSRPVFPYRWEDFPEPDEPPPPVYGSAQTAYTTQVPTSATSGGAASLDS